MFRFNTTWGMVLAAGVCAGCAGTGTGPTKGADDVEAYCQQVYADKALDPVRGKIRIPIRLGEALPIELLADRTHASDQEKPAILALAKANEACRERGVARYGPLPYYRTVSNSRIENLLAQLYAGEITYGQFSHEVLLVGEKDQMAQQQLDDELKLRSRWKDFHDASNNSGN